MPEKKRRTQCDDSGEEEVIATERGGVGTKKKLCEGGYEEEWSSMWDTLYRV